MRRVNERSMTRIEEVDEEDNEEIVDLSDRDVSRMGKQALARMVRRKKFKCST